MSLKLSQAIEGFLLQKSAEKLSYNTLVTYSFHLNHFCRWSKDLPLVNYTKQHVLKFFKYLETEYKPRRWNKSEKPVSAQYMKNAHIALKSFYRWAVEEFNVPNIMVTLACPKVIPPEIEPYTEQEIKAILKAVKTKDNQGRRAQNVFRNEAIILILLDTGIRASELCNLKVADYEARESRLKIIQGKGSKNRTVYLGKASQKVLWRYLIERGEVLPHEHIFTTRQSNHLDKTHLRRICAELGQKAGVASCYPHKFRHTFAIEYLRNGGDLFTLQRLLGHANLKTVYLYARVAEVDVARVHKIASPADHWL